MLDQMVKSQRAKKGFRITAVILGIFGILAAILILLMVASIFLYDSGQGQPHFFIVTIFLPLILTVGVTSSLVGVLCNRKNILSWAGTIINGLFGFAFFALIYGGPIIFRLIYD
ncbi:hypothetical protein [Desmospora activa]|uniref:Uncharacterized protein n=1 Tax=Desmospora activa DSM 45169 TaxID=1121389 RepID=A0A2T4Z967_9BACL|nr:hypothetical protein [Desmospora activa]PTM58415.1 hypothetical protein C8J48_0998 [Desmospora activa DSM 45169]